MIDHQDKPDSTPAEAVSFDEVAKALNRLGSLSYQHRQMLKDGDAMSVLEQFVAALQSTDWMFVCGIAGCAVYFVFGLLAGQFHWITAILLPFLIFPYRQQKQTIKEVTPIVRRFADASGYQVPTLESQLLTELRLKHSLTYQQNKLVKAGDTLTVAREIVKSIRRGGWMQIVFMSIGSLNPLVQFVSAVVEIRNGGPWSWTPLLLSIVHWGCLMGFAISFGVVQFRQARRLEFLMGEHPAEIDALRQGRESESDQLSPYRSPQFR